MKLFTIAFTLLLTLTSNTMLAQSYDTEVISAELYSGTIKRTGKLDYKRTLNLSFKSSGYLALLNIDEGELFDKGDLLASLDITELDEDKNSKYAQLMQAKREVTRISRLMKEKMASERDMDVATLDVATKRAAYQVSFYNLDKAQISAPFAGVVLARNTELGEMQSPGQQVLKIAKLEWVVKVALTGQEVSQVRLNQKVNVALNHMGRAEGIISKIPATANTASNLFTIEVLLPNIGTTAGMIAGQLANVSINFESEAFVYRLPIAALVAVDDEGKAIVVAKTQGTDFKQYSFEVFQLDNDYVYLMAKRNDSPLQIITKGWQNYSMGGN
jgi:RND family efflux transporter MFP subunit